MTRLFASLSVFALLILGACKGASTDEGTASANSIEENAFAVSGPSLMEVGAARTFTLTSDLVGGGTPDSVEWTFSDGQTASGADPLVSFATPGIVNGVVTASSGGNVLVERALRVSVVDGSSDNSGYLGLPVLFGDADEDTVFGLADVLATAQNANGNFALGDEGLKAADVDLSGVVENRDASLLAQALLNGAALPSAVLDEFVYAAGITTIVSPALTDATAEVTIFFDGVKAPAILRPALGYANAHVPTTLAGTGADIPVTMEVGGTVVDTMFVELRETPSLPADAKADVLLAFEQLQTLMELQSEAAAELIDGSGGLNPADEEIVVGASQSATSEFETAVAGIEELLNGEGGGELAEFLQSVFYANGLTEFREEFDALNTQVASGPSGTQSILREFGLESRALSRTVPPGDVCSKYVPAFCAIQTSAKVLSRGSSWLNAACSTTALVALVGGAVIPADGPAIEATALAGYVKFCLPLQVPLTVASVIGDLLTPLGVSMSIHSDKTSLKGGDTAIITSKVEFLNFAQLCGLGATKGGEELIKRTLAKNLVGRVMKKSTALGLLGDVFAKVGEDAYVSLLRSVEDLTKNSLSATGFSGAFTNFANTICTALAPDGLLTTGGLQADTKDFNLQVTNGGVLTRQSDGTSTLACPADPSSQSDSLMVVSGSKSMCGKSQSDSVNVSCGQNDVTITMGDNGTLNDDIFEVLINGQTILTSSSPVRSTSTTVSLPAGQTTVQMVGRAAPDGVGTYFISFSGATVISGQTRGSDLTPGTVKTFVIEVQANGS